MPKEISNALTAATVKAAKPGRHADGGGLYLLVKDSGKRSWLLRFTMGGKVRDMGLGAAAGPGAVTLAEARRLAADLMRGVKAGIDPLAERDRLAAEMAAKAQAEVIRAKTFRQVAEAYLEAHEAGWKNAKHRYQWARTLESYAFPVMGDIAIAEVATGDVMAALAPIWRIKSETASRLRGRIELVLDFAKASGWRDGENPARWRGHIANLLPAPGKVARVEHHAALPWAEIAAFMTALRAREATAARALEFTILCASRTGETLGARWREIDRRTAVWTIPADRMKAGREHRVPLSTAAMAVLDDMQKLRPDGDSKGDSFIFPGARGTGALSNMSMTMLLRRMGRGDLTVHGFRSTFRDWCAETTSYPNEMAEIALAHTVADKVEAAYRRGDMMERRRRLMQDWSDFCDKPAGTGDNVVTIRAAV